MTHPERRRRQIWGVCVADLDLRLYTSEPVWNSHTYMAEGLSDTYIQLFGSHLLITQQLMLRADEHLEPGDSGRNRLDAREVVGSR